jgi:hypothetical protein
MAKPKKNDWSDNLADFKNKAVDAAKVVASRAVVGPLNVVMSNKQVKSVAAETSGVNDVKRFKANPSVANAGMVVLSAASYAAPLVKPLYAAKAASAASKAKALPVAESALIKTLRLGKNEGVREGVLRGQGAVWGKAGRNAVKSIQGEDILATNFKLFETTKSAAAVSAGRASNAARTVIQKGKQAESILGAINVTNSLRGTARAMERNPKKK